MEHCETVGSGWTAGAIAPIVWLVAAALVAPLAGCTPSATIDGDAGSRGDARPPDDDARAPHDTGLDAGPCTAAVCMPGQCGAIADGCGSTIDCGTCACTPATFASDCPSRPCEIAVGCDAGACRYEPITCDFERCDCPASGCADDVMPRRCGTGCGGQVCDPRGHDVSGHVVYDNACVARDMVHCGLCGLGGYACATDGTLSCEAPSFDWIDPAMAECRGSSPLSTVIYVDAAVAGDADGSREHPFPSYADAIAAAIVRGSRVIVIGRSPDLLGSISVESGVSILGGYSGYPAWTADARERPVFHARATDVLEGQHVAIVARAIHAQTRIQHVAVLTDDLVDATGANNTGIWAYDAPDLELVDVEMRIGLGERGAPGMAGTPALPSVDAAQSGGTGYVVNGSACATRLGGSGGATIRCAGTAVPSASGGAGATPAGTDPGPVVYYAPGSAASSGASGGLAMDAFGTFVPGPGQSGAPYGGPAATGVDGAPGLYFDDPAGFPVPIGLGMTGEAGGPGRGGGGGGSGRIYHATVSSGTYTCYVGGGGGGGGAGGCGGGGGYSGQPAGWSFGIVVMGERIVVRDVDVAFDPTAHAQGGEGGPGAPGSPGSPGASGGAESPSSGSSDPMWFGSPGGAGSAGQTGGAGGRGAEGRSVGIVCTHVVTDVTSVSATGPSDVSSSQGCSR